MSKAKLIKSGFIYTLGNLLIQGLAFITLPIYTRVISPEVFGQYSLYMSWVGIFGLFVGLQTSGSFSSAKVRFEEEYEAYVSHALSVSTLFFILCLLIISLFRAHFADWIGFSESIIILLVIQSYCSYLTGLLGIYFITYQRATLNLLLSALTAVTTVALSLGLLFRWRDDFMARVIGGFVPAVLAALVAFVYIYSKGRVFIRKKYLHFTLTVSIPIIFHMLGHQILNQMDRIMIGKLMTVTDVAFYSFGYNLGLIISLVLGSLNTVWTPWFFEQRKAENQLLTHYIHRYLAIAMFLTFGYLTIYPELAFLMGGEKYAESVGFIPIIIVSYFVSFLYTFPVNIQFYHANTKMIPIGTLFAGGINIVLNLILIPVVGIYGAAFATVVSYIALLVFHHLISKRKYAYTDVAAKTYVILSSLVTGYAVLMSLAVHSLILRWSLGLIIIVAYAFYFRTDLKLLLNSMKKRKS